jgi:hypothetical protein
LRVGAVFAVMVLGLTVLAASAASDGDLRARIAHFMQSVRALLPALPVAVVLMGLFWPWSVQAPGNLPAALTTFSHFTFELFTVLNGDVMKIGDVPRHYLPLYLAARLPELTLAGLLCAAACALTFPRRIAWLRWLPVLLAALLPLALAIATRPSLYNGVRHFTFLLPPLTLIAAAGLQGTARWLGTLPCAQAGHGKPSRRSARSAPPFRWSTWRGSRPITTSITTGWPAASRVRPGAGKPTTGRTACALRPVCW